ncbi:glycosyltransferase family 4 protein [Tuwongella immobilis]|uniref:Glycosyl transferase family 1 domain-containing protein n=1 Tax=Tuwongella immobilis TaxID=692036 RepID=A0A6C2YJY7_9BACT|nr:glycosyltransferase family 4 protein [Tuwongella immobilis]VIP01888.1 Glycosyl transferases group 1 family protein OS=Burkholderia multivorans GN=DM81_5665 PE=4 SV=1: Glycos_transf_1 [Tuwongella immobilis]VTR99752.1 Glycosyl transferases group 1 family protein OS=Burkholderia multivorans GN=DM81_5665 PE=4 SV=1: Glycos_transf_1 [Tuwongella immobilis]
MAVPRPLSLGMVAPDWPPRSAVRLAEQGHTVHLFVRAGTPAPGVNFPRIHLHPYQPETDGTWNRPGLGRLARQMLGTSMGVYRAITRMRAEAPLDLVRIPVFGAMAFFTLHDPNFRVVLLDGPGHAGGMQADNPEAVQLCAMERWCREAAWAIEPQVPISDGPLQAADARERLEVFGDRIHDPDDSTWPQTSWRTRKRLRVAVICRDLVPRDATTNVTLQQIEAIDRYARRYQIPLDLRIFATCSRIDDSRVILLDDPRMLMRQSFLLTADVVLVQYGFVNPLADLLPMLPATTRVVTSFVGITPAEVLRPEQRPDIVATRQQAVVLNRANRILTISNYLISDLESLGIDRTKIQVAKLPHAVPSVPSDHLPSENNDGRDSNSSKNHVQMIYLGRFVASKGVHDLLDAFAAVHRQSPQVRLDLCGSKGISDGVYLGDLQAKVNKHRLGDAVRFRFDLSDAELSAALHAADLFVMPSYHEGFCVPVIEALANRCPVLASDAGAIPETLAGLGRTFATGKSSELASAIADCLAILARGEIPIANGAMPRIEWQAAVERYLATLSRETYRSAVIHALFGDEPPVSEAVHAQIVQRISRFADAPETCLASDVSGIVERFLQRTGTAIPEPEGTPVSPPPMRQRLRERIKTMPVVGNLLRSVRNWWRRRG